MNTDKQLPVIERNFHILNDDRFIMEKISLPVEIQDGEDIHAALNRTRETIVQNFKAAYPKVEDSLNFHVVRQMKPDYNELNWYGLKDNAPIHEGGKKLCKLPTDVEFDERNDNLKLPTTIPEKTNKGTIEEHNYHSPDIETIKKEIKSYKYGVKALKSIYGEMVKDSPELKKVFDEKVEELEQKKSIV